MAGLPENEKTLRVFVIV